MGAIKEKMKRDMEIRGLSQRTQQSYLESVTQFVKYFMKSPDQLTLDDIHEYQLHMIREQHYAESTFNLRVPALKFLYGQTLQRKWNVELIPYHKRRKRMPVVLRRGSMSTIQCSLLYQAQSDDPDIVFYRDESE